MNKMWYIHRMEYYLVIKGDEVLLHAMTWMKEASHKRPHHSIYTKCPEEANLEGQKED